MIVLVLVLIAAGVVSEVNAARKSRMVRDANGSLPLAISSFACTIEAWVYALSCLLLIDVANMIIHFRCS